MTLPRKLILLLTGSALGCTYAFIPSMTSSNLGSIESAAPRYFDTTTSAGSAFDNDAGMSALREQAGLALAQLQTKTAP